MSVLSPELVAEPLIVARKPSQARPGLVKRLARIVLVLARLFLAVAFCTQFVTAILVVGWTTRWMRRQIWQGWWRAAGSNSDLSVNQLASLIHLDVNGDRPPRWIVADHFLERWNALAPDGTPPTRLRKLIRLPRLLVGGLFTNLQEGIRTLAATLCITGPGCFLMLAGWRYGWDNSFLKGYEQAYIGRITGFIGVLLLIPALIYLPMGWAHLAASGRFRAFFDRRLIMAVTRSRLAWITLWVAMLAVFAAPLHIAWVRVYNTAEEFPWLSEASPEQLQSFIQGYVFNTCFLVAPLYLISRLLAARIYRVGLPLVLVQRPDLAGNLEHPLWAGLSALGLFQAKPHSRRHPVVAKALATGRWGTRTILWILLPVLCFVFIAEMFVAQFLHAHDFLIWINPVLLHLPCPRWKL